MSALHLAIVGGGVAGLSAAKAARAADAGAQITLISAETSAPYYRPDLSKVYLTGERAHPEPQIASAESLAAMDIAWRNDWCVEEVDLRGGVLRGARGAIGFDRLLLAPGAAPIALDAPGASMPGVFTLRSLDDARALRDAFRDAKDVAIIGAGLIGLEVAAAARACGKRVTVIELAPRVLARTFPALLAQAVADYHAGTGVEFRTGVAADAFEGRTALEAVATQRGRVRADLAVVAIGARPDMRLAHAAGLACDDGILVDSLCQTSAAHVFAAGDATRIKGAGAYGRQEAWRHAEEQGRVAGGNLAGARESYAPALWFWSDQGDLHLQACGSVADVGEDVLRAGADGVSRILFRVREGRLVAAFAMSVRGGMSADVGCLSRLVTQRVEARADELADPAAPLKRLLRRANPAAAAR